MGDRGRFGGNGDVRKVRLELEEVEEPGEDQERKEIGFRREGFPVTMRVKSADPSVGFQISALLQINAGRLIALWAEDFLSGRHGLFSWMRFSSLGNLYNHLHLF